MARSSVRPRLVRLGAALATLWAIGCTDQQSPTAPNLAQGGGGGPTVRAADPDSGFQNTTIDVRVLGSGFDNGSRAVWAIAGDTALATTKITTNSTRFVKSGELVANITIAADAPLAFFDIMVVTAGGKKGIGIEMFEVKETGRYSALFADGAGDMLRSDNGTAYEDGGPDYNPNCVLSFGDNSGGGLYQLRSIANTEPCKDVARSGWRYFRFDLGAPGIDLDQDETAEAIEEAPGRMLAADAFATGATGTQVRILILQVNSDGTTEQDTRWTLHYRVNAAIQDVGGGGRILEASAGNAVVDIYAGYVDVARGKRHTPVATVQLPFRLTLTPMP